jgi:Fic family protein
VLPIELFSHASQYKDSLMDKINFSSFSDILERAVTIHHRLTQIHPFIDGNGRLSRAIMIKVRFQV